MASVMASVFVVYYTQGVQKTDGAIIDAAGRNRMLSQRIGFYAEQVIDGKENTKETLKEIINLHQVSLYALKDGGIAPDISNNRVLPPTNAALMPVVLKAEELWHEYKANADIIANEEIIIDGKINPRVEQAIRFIENNATEQLRRNNEMAKFYVYLNDNHRANAHFILLILLIANTLVLMTGLWLTRITIKPIDGLFAMVKRIGKGDLNVRADIVSNDEIGRLAMAFNETTGKLKESYMDLEKKVNERTVDLQKFRLAVENAAEHIIIADTKGITLYANPVVKEITGYSQKEAIGLKCGKLWGGLMPKSYYDKMWKTIKQDKKTFHGELTNRRKNGEEYIADIIISPILDERNEVIYFVAVERDVSKERALDRAKSQFVSIASHQLRTPVTSIQWIIELILNKEKLSKKGKDYLKDAHVSIGRLSELVDTLLNLTRIESGSVGLTPKPLELIGFVNKMVKEAEMMGAEKKIKFILDSHLKELYVDTDFYALSNIFQTILTNTIEYNLDKGKVSVVVDKKTDTFLCTISDTGIGIPKQDQEKIFGQFVRGSNAYLQKAAGMGIGLYIAQQAADLLGGKIWFESQEGKGTTFYIELPLKSKAIMGDKRLA